MAVFQDTFTEASTDTDLNSHTPDVGTSWSLLWQTGGTSKATVIASTDRCRTNATVANSGYMYTANATYPSADYSVECVVSAGFTGSNRGYLLARVQDSANMYALRFTTGSSTTRMYKNVAGTWTALGSFLTDPAVGDTIKLEVVGSTLKWYINGVLKDTQTDSSITLAGKAGIAAGGGANLAASTDDLVNTSAIDNFTVTDLGSGTGVTVSASIASIVASIVGATVILGATIVPAVQTALFTTQAPTVKYDHVVSPSVQSASLSIPALSVVIGVPTTITHYFDASDAAAADPGSVWTNDANAFNGNTSDFATTSTVGSTASNYLLGEGTQAPTSGDLITQVRARIYGSVTSTVSNPTINAAIYTNGLAELLGTPTNNQGSAAYGSYTTLSAPSGGWSWTALNDLEVKLYMSGGSGTRSVNVYRVEIEVTYLASGGSLTVNPGVQSVTVSVPASSISTSANVTLNVQNVTASLQAPVISTAQNLSLSAQTATFSVPSTSVRISVSPTLSAQSATFSTQSPIVNLDFVISPNVSSAAFSTPARTVQTSSTITPGVQSATFNSQLPTVVVVTNITVLPAAQSALFSVPTPAVLFGYKVSISAQTATFSLPSSTVVIATPVTFSASAQTALFSNPPVSVKFGSTISLGVQSATFSIPTFHIPLWSHVPRDTDDNWNIANLPSNADYTQVSRSPDASYNQISRSSDANYNQSSRSSDDDWDLITRES